MTRNNVVQPQDDRLILTCIGLFDDLGASHVPNHSAQMKRATDSGFLLWLRRQRDRERSDGLFLRLGQCELSNLTSTITLREDHPPAEQTFSRRLTLPHVGQQTGSKWFSMLQYDFNFDYEKVGSGSND